MLISKRLISSSDENRTLAKLPTRPQNLSQIKDFFASTESYLNDHFGNREHYIYRYHRELKKHFGHASYNDTVIQGLDGWLFYNDFNLIKDFFGLVRLNDQDLDAWLLQANEKARWFESQGIHYLYIVPPNKQAIYSQYVMKHALIKKGYSRYEQMVQHSQEKLPEYMVDLHSLLRAESKDKELYYKLDTHWNSRGAYIAFQEIMARIATWYSKEKFVTTFEFENDKTRNTGDLARLIMQTDLTDTYPQLKKIKKCRPTSHHPSYDLSNINQTPGRVSSTETCADKNLRIVVFRDSFFSALKPLFSQNFAEIVFLWKNYDHQNVLEILDYFKPDIVIEEVVERHMFDQFLNDKKNEKELR